MLTDYVQGPDLRHYRKGLHISRKYQSDPRSAKRMPPQELSGAPNENIAQNHLNMALLNES